jgi:hypothetical protein
MVYTAMEHACGDLSQDASSDSSSASWRTNVHGTKEADTISARPTIKSIEDAVQIDRGLTVPRNPANGPDWVLDPEFTCKRCSNLLGVVGASDNSLQELPVRPLAIETLARSQCKVCRLLGITCLSYRAGSETYRLFCSGNYADDCPVFGTYSLTPRFASHDLYKDRIPIFHLVPSEPKILQDALPKLYPKRVDYERVKSWIHECESALMRNPSSHQKCERKLRDTLQSFRVIDCRSMCVITAPAGCDYVALSYVWGQCTRASRPDGSGLLNDLPLTIQDSIAVALSLGYLYIWIDRYVSNILPSWGYND